MEKIELKKIGDQWLLGQVELKEAIDKINEVVEWINRQPKELRELSPEQIERIGRYIQECDDIEWPKKKKGA